MHISQDYKYELNGITYVGGNVPEGATIVETLDILCAEEGCVLVRTATGEEVGNSIWLRNGDVQQNYTEIEQENN